MSVVSMVVGGTTPDSAVVVAKVDGGGPVRVAYDTDPALASPSFSSPVAVDAQGVAKVDVIGLDPDTRYHWRIEDNGVIDVGVTGQFRTHPPLGLPASFTVAVAACAGANPNFPGVAGGELAPDRLSNAPVFDTIRQLDPLMFFHLGDLHYYDPGSGVHVPDGSVATYRSAYDDVLAQPRQHELYRNVSTVYLWDDHDFGPNNSDGTLATKANAAQVYRERWPSWPLTDPDGIWQAKPVGRVLFVGSDVRYYRSPNSAQDGGGGLQLTGATGDGASTPDTAVLDITGDLDLRVDAALDWFAGAGFQYLLTKYTTTSDQRGYALRLNTDTFELQLAWSPDGAAVLSATATQPLVPAAGSGRLAVRATLDVDNGASGHTVTFFTAPTMAGPWVQLGDPVVTAGTTSIFANTADLWVNGINGGTSSPVDNPGTVFAAEVRAGIGGEATIVADPDFAAQTTGTGSFTDSTGKLWTLQGDAEIVVKSMLGAAQKTWLAGLLSTSDAKLLVWLMPSQWLGIGTDTWDQFRTERDELAALLAAHGWEGRVCMVYGDRHAVGIDSGGSNTWGAFPILQAASLDSTPADVDPGRFDVLDDTPGRDQYGTLDVADFGSAIQVTLNAWRGTALLGSHRFGVSVESPTVVGAAKVREFAPVLAGSHMPVFEARVLTEFHTGPEPAGVELPIVGGDVQYDATASVFATLAVTTQGTDPATGKPWFPRLAGDLLAPYGNELFVRRGVDLGGAGVLWSPLGYFRIEDVEQDGPEGPIAISGSDRMAGLIEADVLQPREYPAETPVESVFADLVGDVYPEAVIVFDDDAGGEPIGRQLIVDDSRYEPLLELAEGLGKVMAWDGQGLLVVETAPAEQDVVWRVAAGRDGVLVTSTRRLSRRDAYNAVVLTGEGGSTTDPVQGIAVDLGPNSPTRFGGRFGRVPRRISSPTVTTVAQAQAAARELLRRNLGVPYSADFGSVVNPALRPRMVVLVQQRTGDRERHIVQTLTVPLTAEAHMTGTTRQRTHVVIGSQVS